MKVVILCGGMGTRMRGHPEPVPKPLITVGTRPILWHIMKYYAHFGFRDFVLCLGYKREAFVDFFLNYRCHNSDLTVELGGPGTVEFHDHRAEQEDWRVTLADTGLRSNTGERLRRVARYLDGECFMLTYGDGLGAIDLRALLRQHRRSRKLATVSAVHPTGRFGEVELHGADVVAFAEKPQTSSGFINGGFMVFEHAFIDRYLAEDCVLEADALACSAREGELAAYVHEGFWQCMDTPREHELLEQLWDSGRAPWKVWDAPAQDRPLRNGSNERLTFRPALTSWMS
jgi:glucose-1-phosphate cytidylyltransferase